MQFLLITGLSIPRRKVSVIVKFVFFIHLSIFISPPRFNVSIDSSSEKGYIFCAFEQKVSVSSLKSLITANNIRLYFIEYKILLYPIEGHLYVVICNVTQPTCIVDLNREHYPLDLIHSQLVIMLIINK